MKSSLLAVMLSLLATAAHGQPRNADQLHQHLERAIARREWGVAQGMVLELLVLQPERSAELTAYWHRLALLAGSPPVSLATPTPLAHSLVEGLQVHSVTARVKTTREIVLAAAPKGRYVHCRDGSAPVRITLPHTYEVVVRVMGATGLPTQRIPVLIAINDGEIELTPDFLLGSRGIASHTVTIQGSQVPIPRTVRVTLPNGVSRSFGLALPPATTILDGYPPLAFADRLGRDPHGCW